MLAGIIVKGEVKGEWAGCLKQFRKRNIRHEKKCHADTGGPRSVYRWRITESGPAQKMPP